MVEPVNAWRSGVDLVGAMLDVAGRRAPTRQGPGQVDVATHQLLLAVLGAAQGGGGRRAIARELIAAARCSGIYAGSSEELTPVHRDRRAALPLVAASVATLARPSSWQAFARGSVANYAVTPEGWTRSGRAVLVPEATALRPRRR